MAKLNAAVLIIFLTTMLFPVSAVADAVVDHSIWDELLKKHNHQGRVDYNGFKKEEARLDLYLDTLAGIDPQSLGRDEQFAAPGLQASIASQRDTIKVKYLDYDWSLNGE